MTLTRRVITLCTRKMILKSKTVTSYSKFNNLRLLSSTTTPLFSGASAASPEPKPTPPLPPTPKMTAGEPIAVSTSTGQEKKYDPKLVKIVNDIAGLTLLEVSELNECLKKTLNIPDTPMMMPMGAVGAFGGAPAGAVEQEEEESAPQKVQTSFTLKLLKFDDTKKVPLIKEIKSLIEGMNLVQAKKFVESAPTVVKADIPKDEAEKLSAALTAVGATCEIS